jgi:hypothetical protein
MLDDSKSEVLFIFLWFSWNYFQSLLYYALHLGARRGCDRMVVGFITTYAISAYHLPLML